MSVCSLVAVDDAASGEVVRAQLDDHSVLGQNADVVLTHLAGNVAKHDVSIAQFHAEHRIRQGFDNRAFDFDDAVLLRHILRLSSTTFSDSNGLRPFGIALGNRHTAPKDTSKGRAYAILALLGKLDAVSIASRLMLASYQHRHARGLVQQNRSDTKGREPCYSPVNCTQDRDAIIQNRDGVLPLSGI